MSAAEEPAAAPPRDAVLAVDPRALAARLGSIPDADNALLRLADGRRSAERIVAEAGGDAGAARAALARLLAAGVLHVVPPDAAAPSREPGGPEGVDWFASPSSAARPRPEPARPEADSQAGSRRRPDDPGVMVIAAPPGAERARRRALAWSLALLGAAALLLLGRALLGRLHP